MTRTLRVHFLAAIVFDHIITMGREIELFWKRKFSGVAALFLTNRYLIIVDYTLILAIRLNTGWTDQVSLNKSIILIGRAYTFARS